MRDRKTEGRGDEKDGLSVSCLFGDPIETRRVIGLALSASLNVPIEKTKYGVFRM